MTRADIITPMIIVGLGNPGAQYARNRHNAGKIVVEEMARTYDQSPWREDPKRLMSYKKIHVQEGSYVFVLPNSYMNVSGRVVASALTYFDTDVRDLYIVHDDLDLTLGAWKLEFARGPKQHNGIISIEESLKTDQFYRMRIGVDQRDPLNRIDGETYVLQDFANDEYERILAACPTLWHAIRTDLRHPTSDI